MVIWGRRQFTGHEGQVLEGSATSNESVTHYQPRSQFPLAFLIPKVRTSNISIPLQWSVLLTGLIGTIEVQVPAERIKVS